MIILLVKRRSLYCLFTDAGNDMLSEEAVLSMLDINVKGTILCARHAAQSMKNHGVDGHIININRYYFFP